MTHSGFEKIPVSHAAQEEFIKGELRELSLAIEQQPQEHNSRIVKMLERAKKRLEGKLKELAAVEHKDDGLTSRNWGWTGYLWTRPTILRTCSTSPK